MAAERIRLRTRDRRAIDADADVVRYAMPMRFARGGGIFLVGVALGAATLPIPVLHLILPWGIPLLALMIGVFVARQAIVAREVRATCPDCASPIVAPGGPVGDDLWIRCPKCTLPLHVEVPP